MRTTLCDLVVPAGDSTMYVTSRLPVTQELRGHFGLNATGVEWKGSKQEVPAKYSISFVYVGRKGRTVPSSLVG